MSGEEALGVLYVSLWTLAKPDDFTLAPELLNDLLPVWWGERAQINSTDLNEAEVFGSEAGWRTKLESLEQDGQICAAKDKIIDAAKNQRIEFFVWREGGEKPQPLSFALWHTTEFSLLDNSIHFGAVRLDDNGLVPDEKGKSLILRKEDANDWLNEIRSPHVLPEPLKRSGEALPEKDAVSLCELVTWLADGEALMSDQETAQTKAREAEFTEFMDRCPFGKSSDELLSMNSLWGDRDTPALARLVAKELAREVRIRDAKVAIEKAIRDGKIRGYADGASGSGQREPIPSQQIPEPLPSNFERDDLIRLWGDVADGSSSGPARGMDADPTILPRFSRAEVEAAYRKRVKDWPPDQKPPSGKEDEEWLRNEFGVRRARAREIRKEFALESWQAQGRRKTRRN